MTIVLDTNVLFAALTARSGLCARLFELCLSRHLIVSSEHILGELRPHLAGKARLTPAQIDAAIAAIASPVVRVVIPTPVASDACRDSDDLAVLGAAIAGAAEVIVTGGQRPACVGRVSGSAHSFAARLPRPISEPG